MTPSTPGSATEDILRFEEDEVGGPVLIVADEVLPPESTLALVQNGPNPAETVESILELEEIPEKKLTTEEDHAQRIKYLENVVGLLIRVILHNDKSLLAEFMEDEAAAVFRETPDRPAEPASFGGDTRSVAEAILKKYMKRPRS